MNVALGRLKERLAGCPAAEPLCQRAWIVQLT